MKVSKILGEYILQPIWQTILSVVAGAAILIIWSSIMAKFEDD